LKRPEPRIAELEAEIDDLQSQLEHVKRDRDYWRSMFEAAHRSLSMRAEFAQQTQQVQFIQARADLMQAQAQQALAQQAQQMQFAHPAKQALSQTFEGWCNCVPARHDLFLTGD
jgi:hypothetical protein